ncbi:MAG: DnaD-like protein [Firmicutes bacterium]|nr:DnaD-like protein [Bacillota bacterium]
MPRKRDIKPGFFKNEDLGELPPLARLFFAGLWCWADREGRFEDRPKKLRADILAYDNCDGEELMQLLADRRFVIRYEVDGIRYGQINNFADHQSPHPNEAASAIPVLVNEESGICNLSATEEHVTPTVLVTKGQDASNDIVTDEQVTTNLLATDKQCTCNPYLSFTSYSSFNTETKRARDEETVSEIFTVLQNKFGIINTGHRDLVLDMIDHYPCDWIIQAIDRAVKYKKRRVGYLDAILKGWRDEGYEDLDKPWEVDKDGTSKSGNRGSYRKSKAGTKPSEVDWDAEKQRAL